MLRYLPVAILHVYTRVEPARFRHGTCMLHMWVPLHSGISQSASYIITLIYNVYVPTTKPK